MVRGAGPSSPSCRRALRSGLRAFVLVSCSLAHLLRTYRLEKGRGKNPLQELSRRNASAAVLWKSHRSPSLGRNSGPREQGPFWGAPVTSLSSRKGHGRSSGRYDAFLPVFIKTIVSLPSLRCIEKGLDVGVFFGFGEE